MDKLDMMIDFVATVGSADDLLLAKCTLRTEIDRLIAEAHACWVSVDDRLPEDYVDVLVLWHWDDTPDKLQFDLTRK